MEANVVSFPTIVSSRRSVPNEQPIREPDSYRIALIGEAPGEDEENHRRPFVGRSGQFLTNILNDVGIDRTKCLLGNVCQFRPPGNRIEAFDWNGPEIQDGLAKLKDDICVYNPHLVVCLGNTPLRAARGPCKITDWRGSLFTCSDLTSPFYSRKCISSLHPAFVLREFSGFPLLKFDLKRAADEGKSPTLDLPKRELITNASADDLCYMMDTWPTGQRCSVDIEGGLPRDVVNVKRLTSKGKYKSKFGWTCVSLSARPTKAYTIVWNKFSESDHMRLLQSFARLMYRYDVPKVLQNQLYDNFVLSYGYSIPVRNVTEDVMIKGWAVYAELPRALSVQASIWTREPHWKDETMYLDRGEGLYRGCAVDSAVTLEICNVQDQVLKGPELQHYRSMVQIENPFHYMEQRGMLYDLEEVARQIKKNDSDMSPIRERLAQSAGYDLCGKTSLSQKKLVNCLYAEKKYPPQYKVVFEHGSRTKKLTTDIEALLNLKKITTRSGLNDSFLNDVIEFRHLEGIRETLNIPADPDGRVRCGYSLEAETGRVKCYTSPTGSGANMQTIQKFLRTVYIADSGMDFFQCDLAGADGWTVAANCARLGDPTMLEDYQYGLKPAKIVLLLHLFGSDVNDLDRSDIKMWSSNPHWFIVTEQYGGPGIYECTKQVYHGTDYQMGIPTMQVLVMKKSFKETGVALYLEHSTARELQNCVFTRYKGISTWHAWAESKLVADGTLVSASGQKRIFFGRRFGKDIKDTVKEFLSHEPQSNTTWATNLAMLALWNDPNNRRPDGSLIIEPLHQVHDALCGQYPSHLKEWAVKKIQSYFDNKLTIAGIEITIPHEMGIGRSWGELIPV